MVRVVGEGGGVGDGGDDDIVELSGSVYFSFVG